MGQAFGVEVVSVTVPYGEPVQPGQLADALARHPDAAAVCSTLCETATGVRNDIAAFGELVGPNARLSPRGCHQRPGRDRVPHRRLAHGHLRDGLAEGADAAAGPGVRSVSDKRGRRSTRTGMRGVLLRPEEVPRQAEGESDTPFTPANTLFRALRTSLKKIRAEGIENVWARHARMRPRPGLACWPWGWSCSRRSLPTA